MSRETTRRHWTRQPTLEQVEREAQFVALKAAKKTYPEIAAEMGCSVSTAHKHVTRGLRNYLAGHGAAEAAAEMLLELDLATRAIWPRVLDGDDAAIDRLVKIQKRRADLLGADAPKNVKVTWVSMDSLDAEIASLAAQLGRNDLVASHLDQPALGPGPG
ncbi:MAG: helix-turn-helix domain-containing protein [Pseudomonadota bacterium]